MKFTAFKKGDCVFVDHSKYYNKALNSAASAIIINKEVACPDRKALIIHPEPFAAFNLLTKHFRPISHSKKAISDSAKIGKNTVIKPGCIIGNHVIIYDYCVIGNNVTIQANTTIGSDAFYFKKRESNFEPLYTCGDVVIENDVVIGANCTIDKGVTATLSRFEGKVHYF
jgi:UDP-3-O-[3-hydroxymyristoyl] glucosamine N-acyltransferase